MNSLKDIYYQGSQSEWNSIDKEEFNDMLSTVTIHYNAQI